MPEDNFLKEKYEEWKAETDPINKEYRHLILRLYRKYGISEGELSIADKRKLKIVIGSLMQMPDKPDISSYWLESLKRWFAEYGVDLEDRPDFKDHSKEEEAFGKHIGDLWRKTKDETTNQPEPIE